MKDIFVIILFYYILINGYYSIDFSSEKIRELGGEQNDRKRNEISRYDHS